MRPTHTCTTEEKKIQLQYNNNKIQEQKMQLQYNTKQQFNIDRVSTKCARNRPRVELPYGVWGNQ